jgi:hypothetical protein
VSSADATDLQAQLRRLASLAYDIPAARVTQRVVNNVTLMFARIRYRTGRRITMASMPREARALA